MSDVRGPGSESDRTSPDPVAELADAAAAVVSRLHTPGPVPHQLRSRLTAAVKTIRSGQAEQR